MQIAKSRIGNAAKTSIVREMPLSIQRPKKPAATPARMADGSARIVAEMPMTSELRAP